MLITAPAAPAEKRYTPEELSEMTTYRLNSICYAEKIVSGVAGTLDRAGLIQTILKFRGAEESLLIEAYDAHGYARINEILHTCLAGQQPDDGGIHVPARMTLFRELGIQRRDRYAVTAGNGIGESNVLLVDENNVVQGIFNLVKDETRAGGFWLVNEQANLQVEQCCGRTFSLLFFGKHESDCLYRAYAGEQGPPPARLPCFRAPLIGLEIKTLEETAVVLAIDFGTANTTAGAFLGDGYVSTPCHNDVFNKRVVLNEINYVHFRDCAATTESWTAVTPTVVYVLDCADPSHIRYCFGHEAVSRMKSTDYISRASIFQGIKRWVNSYETREDICDARGNTATVTRGEIIRAYLEHVIAAAEHQFKCRFKRLHLSSPVTLKQQYIGMFREILGGGYEIEEKDALDEGSAALYNTIADQIEQRRFVDGKEYKALIIDCGGGTTDMSSCAFSITEGESAYTVNISTRCENGDTHFGGDNITYRIMQFMKIVFAAHYSNRPAAAGDLLPEADDNIFRIVDQHGADAVYRTLEKTYEEAGLVIPTRFKDYEHRPREEYLLVKNNFYFLWEIAETMKKEFFRKSNILRSRFDPAEGAATDGTAGDLHVTPLRRWCLAVVENGGLQTRQEFPGTVFTIREIHTLIKADIYRVVAKFLEPFYANRTLQDYAIIKLTGQSCRIDIFKEALKEFVPGKSIEFKQRKEGDDPVPDLKLACLRGALRYIKAKSRGDIEATVTRDIPATPYAVSAFTHSRQEKTLLCTFEGMAQPHGSIARPLGVEEVEFFLTTADGSVQKKYICKNDVRTYAVAGAGDVAALTEGVIAQDDADRIKNGQVQFFLTADRGGWGFNVVPAARSDGRLFIGKKKYYPLDNDLSALDYFDGQK